MSVYPKRPVHRLGIAASLLLILFRCLMFLPAPCARAQDVAVTPDWNGIFKLHWSDRVRQFRDENRTLDHEQNVILLGDSLTEKFDVERFLPGQHVLNRGISADTIGNALPESDKRGILRRMDESIFNCKPGHVFLLVGINDLAMGHTPDTVESGYREILQQVKSRAPQVHLHVQSVLPTRGEYVKHNSGVKAVNTRLQKLAREFGYDYIDVQAKLTDEHGELRAAYTVDGLHLSDAGYRVWSDELAGVLGWK